MTIGDPVAEQLGLVPAYQPVPAALRAAAVPASTVYRDGVVGTARLAGVEATRRAARA